MSKYMILIYEDEADWGRSEPGLMDQALKRHLAFGTVNARAVLGGEAVDVPETATTLRPDGFGGCMVTDGPFHDTKEALSGYYLVDAGDLDEALALAKQLPLPFGGIEIRPVRLFY